MGVESQAFTEKSSVGTQEKVGARDDGKWGPCDIIKKTFEIYRGQACTFTWIQIAIVFPCVIVWLLSQFLAKKLFHEYKSTPPCPAPCPPSQPCFGDDPSPCQWKEVVAFVTLLLLGFIFLINVVGSLFFAVGGAYAGKTICFNDVVAALPGLWKGLIATGLWAYVFYFVTAVVIFLLGSLLVTFASVSFLPLPIAVLLTVSVGSILFFFFTTTTKMAYGVDVFDQVCGLPAFSKALDLLKCKWCVALGIAIVFLIPHAILTAIVHGISWACTGEWAKIVFFGVLANLLSVVTQLYVMASALFYISAKQSKNQSISVDHFSFSQDQFESGYQRVGV